ncbi:MAG: hypothetical protein QNK36_21045 [Colwellia sp.]|nr:hypothetical protein [Colwellia sp.]
MITTKDTGIEAETLGLTKGQSKIVFDAYDWAYNGNRKKYCPHHAISANEETGNLELDLSAVALSFEMSLLDFIATIGKPYFEGRFTGLEIIDAGVFSVKEQLLYGIEPFEFTGVLICYQLDDTGERVKGVNDIEITVKWNTSMTKTSDYRLIEDLIFDLGKPDFTIEMLNKHIAKIGFGANQ